MTDPRVADYARLLVDRCVDVQAGWQVAVSAGYLARPLLVEVVRLVARRVAADSAYRLAVPREPSWAAEGLTSDGA